MAQTVIGIFDNTSEAQDAVEQLISNGFTRDNVDIAARNADSTVGSTGTTSSYDTDRKDRKDKDDDSIGGFFRSLFGSDDDDDDRVRNYSEVARRGSIVTVHAQSAQEAERAADILDEYGAVDIDERANQYRSGVTGSAVTDMTSDTYTGTTPNTTTDESQSIQVIEEQMQVGKRTVETGGKRLRSRIIERPVEETLRLREEHVHVERRPVNRAATEAELTNFKEGTIEMTEHAEVPLVNKEARVVEEINLDKDVEERQETIRDTVRKTDVEVENLGTDTTLRTDEDLRTNDKRRFDADDERGTPANR